MSSRRLRFPWSGTSRTGCAERQRRTSKPAVRNTPAARSPGAGAVVCARRPATSQAAPRPGRVGAVGAPSARGGRREPVVTLGPRTGHPPGARQVEAERARPGPAALEEDRPLAVRRSDDRRDLPGAGPLGDAVLLGGVEDGEGHGDDRRRGRDPDDARAPRAEPRGDDEQERDERADEVAAVDVVRAGQRGRRARQPHCRPRPRPRAPRAAAQRRPARPAGPGRPRPRRRRRRTRSTWRAGENRRGRGAPSRSRGAAGAARGTSTCGCAASVPAPAGGRRGRRRGPPEEAAHQRHATQRQQQQRLGPDDEEREVVRPQGEGRDDGPRHQPPGRGPGPGPRHEPERGRAEAHRAARRTAPPASTRRASD